MDQDVSPVEPGDPIQQSDSKKEDFADTEVSVDDKQAPADIGPTGDDADIGPTGDEADLGPTGDEADISPTGDVAENAPEDVNTEVDTAKELVNEAEGMEIDEPVPISDALTDSVSNEADDVDDTDQTNVDPEDVTPLNVNDEQHEENMEVEQEVSDVRDTVDTTEDNEIAENVAKIEDNKMAENVDKIEDNEMAENVDKIEDNEMAENVDKIEVNEMAVIEQTEDAVSIELNDNEGAEEEDAKPEEDILEDAEPATGSGDADNVGIAADDEDLDLDNDTAPNQVTDEPFNINEDVNSISAEQEPDGIIEPESHVEETAEPEVENDSVQAPGNENIADTRHTAVSAGPEVNNDSVHALSNEYIADNVDTTEVTEVKETVSETVSDNDEHSKDSVLDVLDENTSGAINEGDMEEGNLDTLDDDAEGVGDDNDDGNGSKEQSVEKETESDKQEAETAEDVGVLSNDDINTQTEVSEEVNEEENQEMETDADEKLGEVENNKEAENVVEDPEDIKVDTDDNLRVKSGDSVSVDGDNVELSENKVEGIKDTAEGIEDTAEGIDNTAECIEDTAEGIEDPAEGLEDTEMDITENIDDSDENIENGETGAADSVKEVANEAGSTESGVSSVKEASPEDLAPVSETSAEQNVDEDIKPKISEPDVTESEKGHEEIVKTPDAEPTYSEMEAEETRSSQIAAKTEASETSDDSNDVVSGKDASPVVDGVTEGVAGEGNQSDSKASPKNQSADSNSVSPSVDMACVKIKQERLGSTDEDKTSEQVDNGSSSHLKIVGVTSAADMTPVAVETSESSTSTEDSSAKSGAKVENTVDKKVVPNAADTKTKDVQLQDDFPGPFCKQHNLSTKCLNELTNLPAVENVTNGLVLELKAFGDKHFKTFPQVYKILCKLKPEFREVTSHSIHSKVRLIIKAKRKLTSKKKLHKWSSIAELKHGLFPIHSSRKDGIQKAVEEPATVLAESNQNLKCGDEQTDMSGQNTEPVCTLANIKGEKEDVIAVKDEKKPTPKVKSSKIQNCIVCKRHVKCKYNIVRNGDVKHLCDDNCFKSFRLNPTTYLKQAAPPTEKTDQAKPETLSQASDKTVAPRPVNQPTPVAQQSQVYKSCTVCQLMNIRTSKPFLNWQGLDFCGEECLGKFQFGLNSNCSYCSGPIFPNNKAKFCCRVGNDVKQFCSSNCNNDFIKRMKVCAYCNKDLTQLKDSFMAPVGNQGTFKDFCSQPCLQRFEEKNNKDAGLQSGLKTTKAPKGNFSCAVCSKIGPVKHEFKLDSKMNRLCSDPCFSAFQYANKLTMNNCDNCSTNLNADQQTPQYVQFEGQQKRFCSFMCVNSFMNSNKKIVPCAWCGSKKSNFDMIERVDANNKYQLFCSLNCLSLYRVNLQASSNQSVVCDQCRKFVPAQYHLTMSDASVRNFCSYGCVMQFQQQFQMPAKQPATQNITATGKTVSQMIQQQKLTTTRSGRVVQKGPKVAEQLAAPKRQGKKESDSFPIISNVMSLAPQGPQPRINAKAAAVPVTTPPTLKTTSSAGNQTVQQKIIIQPPPPVPQKNKSLMCKPITQTKATSCRPHTQTKEVQTDGKAEPDKLPVPVPVPIYCPTPLAMYNIPTPILIAVPIPIPVPIFIPTTKKSANSILKQIKEIREKIPADPLEAELLMMAEAVAGKDDDSSSSSDEDEPPAPVMKETPAAPASESAELGEDMLQMALRMASEMSDEPVMDLETSLEPVAVNTEPPPQPKPEVAPEPIEEEEEYIPSARTRRSRGGGSNKRQSRSSTGARRNPKRQKVEVQQVYREPTPSPPAPAAPPPDANFHLKYTYGVNAFKHWVLQKNSQIEQTSKSGQGKSLKTFKTDILQCTADELNYSLCLFVKEVRKPNGEEYAVDSIYYLCLGIQQYLFENGRIDNIFTDFYYERFTEGLNEILTRYEPKLNHAGQLVCRIEEEHLWESKQLGAHSPHVLLNSLVYFNTKYFMLKTSEDHLKLSFTHIMKHWKKTATGRGSGTGPNAGRSVYLRYYCPTPQGKVDNTKKKKEEMPVYEQTENLENPLRCPVKLYEFYLSKCPESIKSRNDTFYLQAERSSVPDSPVWYSNISVDGDRLAKLLNRIRLVREIQEAHLHTQPIYI